MEPPAAGTTQEDGSSRGVLLYLSPRVVLIVASMVATQGINGRVELLGQCVLAWALWRFGGCFDEASVDDELPAVEPSSPC